MAVTIALTFLLALQASEGLLQLRGNVKEGTSRTCQCALHGSNCYTEKPTPRLNYGDANLVECKIPPEKVHGGAESKFKLNYASFLQQRKAVGENGDSEYILMDEKSGPERLREHLNVHKDIDGEKTIYLTFDDGILCDDKNCSGHFDFLDTMDYYGAKVTQFMISNRFRTKMPEYHEEYNPCRTVHYSDIAADVAREYAKRGHAIGSHTKSHLDVTKMKFENAKADIRRADEVLRNYTGLDKIKHFRAPFLRLNDEISEFLVDEMHYDVWGAVNGGNSDWESWELPSTSSAKYATPVAERVQEYFQERPDFNSAVICLHDRPLHRKHFGTMLSEICKVCPECEFRSLDGKGTQ